MATQTDVSIRFKNYVEGEKKLERYAETLKTVNAFLTSIDVGKASAISQSSKDISSITSKKTQSSLDNMAKKVDIAFNYSAIKEFGRQFYNVVKNLSSYTKKSAEYLENWNLLDVAFQNNTEDAEKLVNTLSEMYGLDESWGYRTVGIFKQLSNAMGLADDVGNKLSKTLTQFAIDTSSLYNIDVEDTVSILQSALAGQTKPARRLGADITQNTLQLTLDTYGIDRAITDLSYAEKRLLIVASMITQVQEAWGDWGRTIESVANQMRVFQQQTERLTRAIGNVFLPILKMALPYMNAILMVLTEIIQSIAVLVGYNEEEFDFFTTDDSVIDFTEDIANLGGALDSTTQSAKALQMGLRAFDKLNNIKTPTTTSGTGGVGVSGGGIGAIDEDILDLFNKTSDSYLDNLDKIEMKATKIRDAIMETLGFQKQINLITGDVSWKYLGWQETVKGLLDWFTKLNTTSKIFVGLAIGKALLSIYNGFKKITSLKLVSNIITPYKNLVEYTKLYTKLSGSFTNGLSAGAEAWRKNLTPMQKFTTFLTSATIGLSLMDDALDRNNKNLADLGITMAESLSATTSFALAGYSIAGPWGALVGIIGGSTVSLLQNANQMKINTDIGAKYVETLNGLKEQALANVDVTTLQMEKAQLLSGELEKYIDSNGRVKESDEARVEYILGKVNEAFGTEYELIDGIISQNGKQVESYEAIEESISNMLETKKRELKLRAYEDVYVEALKQQRDLQGQIDQKVRTLEFTEERLNQARKTGFDEYGVSYTALLSSYKRQKEELGSLEDAYKNSQDEVNSYNLLLEASMSENVEEFDKAMQLYEEGSLKTAEQISGNYSENITSTYDKILKKIPDSFKKWIPKDFKTNLEVETSVDTTKIKNIFNDLADKVNANFKTVGIKVSMPRLKTGIDFVPNDFYPAYLDYGERVLTKEENADYNKGIIKGKVASSNNTTNATFIIKVGDEEVARKVLNNLEEMAISNGEPITIGG